MPLACCSCVLQANCARAMLPPPGWPHVVVATGPGAASQTRGKKMSCVARASMSRGSTGQARNANNPMQRLLHGPCGLGRGFHTHTHTHVHHAKLLTMPRAASQESPRGQQPCRDRRPLQAARAETEQSHAHSTGQCSMRPCLWRSACEPQLGHTYVLPPAVHCLQRQAQSIPACPLTTKTSCAWPTLPNPKPS